MLIGNNFIEWVHSLRLPSRRDRRSFNRIKKLDIVREQVKDILKKADQKLILMVRG